MTILLEVDTVRAHFPVRSAQKFRRSVGKVRAVDGVSLSLDAGETLALVGESGSGKSTLARVVLCLEKPTAGSVFLQGELVNGPKVKRSSNGGVVQVVLQNPHGSLNPRMPVGNSVTEPLRANRIGDRKSQERRAGEVLEQVGLNASDASRYPHEFSGGQLQRIAIARALAPRPKLIVCDEAVSALDVSVQAQIIKLLRQVQTEENVSLLFISHDLAAVRQIAHQVAVMRLGKIVEFGDSASVFDSPEHPYTRALLDAIPISDPDIEATRKRI